ncbi:MAG: class I SAM-dependent methyltransferase [Prolixibacteraceae bacterium]|nr:class I SAM-dependent methyltransferase [Prolixibacteraceae bacterium]
MRKIKYDVSQNGKIIMQKRHTDRKLYFKEQERTFGKHVLPFIQEVKEINEQTSVLEIGCGEGGNLIPFLKLGCNRIVGIDMSKGKIENAKEIFGKFENVNPAEFIVDDIFNVDIDDIGQFDIIITRDVLEHIHGQEKFMKFVKKFLKSDGKFFLGFPPWYNPFGGHQQMCDSKFLSKIPYFHILPKFMYRFILKVFGESDAKIRGLLEVKDTGITIERFQRILKQEQYLINKRSFYFINPNYEVKFGLKPRKAWKLITIIPIIRNFFITTNYYLISKK